MPVRIYDIAKKLGIESKEVLAKAKELGMTAAKVPSSSLDKITAEQLEGQFQPAAPATPAPAPTPPQPMSVITEAPPAPIPATPEFQPHIEIRGEVLPPPTAETEESAAPALPQVEAPQAVETRAMPEPEVTA